MSVFSSIWTDVQQQYRYGNMVVRLILANVAVFLGVHLVDLFLRIGSSSFPLDWLAMPMNANDLLYRAWTPITYMFLHWDFWHLLWNMLFLFWFGRILQDLLGNRRILPIYFYGGLAGAAVAFALLNLLPDQNGTILLGASAGVSAVLMAAATLAPNYEIMLFVWPVRIKYIALARIVLDIIAVKGFVNTGGSVAHLGGVAIGYMFIRLLQQGTDLSLGFNSVLDGISRLGSGLFSGRRRPGPRVAHRQPQSAGPADADRAARRSRKPRSRVAVEEGISDKQARVDQILDKIGKSGYDSLSKDEKEFLFKFSKEG
jgi:membrane associated rhomboid family serine protease